MTVRIGLTGPIGCGKSTLAGWLRDAGATVVDADAIARTVLDPGTPELARVLARFGPSVARSDGSLDRAALAAIVFADGDALAELEAIVHPAVRPRILAAIAAAEEAAAPAVVVEAIKLVEGGLADLCDEVWLVTCDPHEQRERLTGRGLPVEDVSRRIAAQAGLPGRVAEVASRVVDTSGPPDRARADALAAYRSALATGRTPGA